MIIPVRCFTCGKVSLITLQNYFLNLFIFRLSVTNGTSTWTCSSKKVALHGKLTRKMKKIRIKGLSLWSSNIAKLLMILDLRDTAAEECCLLMSTWFLNFLTTTVRLLFHDMVYLILLHYSLWAWKGLRALIFTTNYFIINS